jgi:hypothetical protein
MRQGRISLIEVLIILAMLGIILTIAIPLFIQAHAKETREQLDRKIAELGGVSIYAEDDLPVFGEEYYPLKRPLNLSGESKREDLEQRIQDWLCADFEHNNPGFVARGSLLHRKGDVITGITINFQRMHISD